MTTEVIVALDVDTLQEEEELLKSLHGTVTHYKIGLRLFTAHGRKAVDMVHQRGGKVFLDLKFHDIPQTVAHAVHEAQRLHVHAVSLHLSGGADMLEAAAAVHPRPKLWGVSVLTSLSAPDLKVLHPRMAVRPLVLRLARMGLRHKLDGVICSGQEAPALKRALGPDVCLVTPGIRPAGREMHDQKRAVTPAEAARLGIRYAVVGRPITKAPNPLAAAQEILAEMRAAVPLSA